MDLIETVQLLEMAEPAVNTLLLRHSRHRKGVGRLSGHWAEDHRNVPGEVPVDPGINMGADAMTRIKDFRRDLHRRRKEFEPLSRDPWIKTNSDIEPQKLHALGVITFRWNFSENKLFDMFQALLKLPIEEAHALADGLKNEEVVRRIKTLASSRIKNKEALKLISNVLVLLHHKILCRECLAICAEQQGHRGKVLTKAAIRRRRMVAIELGM